MATTGKRSSAQRTYHPTNYRGEDLLFSGLAVDGPVDGRKSLRLTAGIIPKRKGTIPVLEAEKRDATFQNVPAVPGVYAISDRDGIIVYVGKSGNLRRRLGGYLRAKEVDGKSWRLRTEAASIYWESYSEEFAALLREVELIELLRPKLNIRDNPNKYYSAYLCMAGGEFPHFYLSRHNPVDAVDSVGPLFLSDSLKSATRALNDHFLLIDCPSPVTLRFSEGERENTRERPGCLRFETAKCFAPCIAACGKKEYLKAAKRSLDIFAGGSDIIGSIEVIIEQKIIELAFEQAAILEERRKEFIWLKDQIKESRQQKKKFTFIYTTAASWYVIDRGNVIATLPTPISPPEKIRMSKLLSRLVEKKMPANRRTIRSFNLVKGWFKRNPEELANTIGFVPALERLTSA